jgi:hypothetical protein
MVAVIRIIEYNSVFYKPSFSSMARIFVLSLTMLLFSCKKEYSCCAVGPTDIPLYQNVEASSTQNAREACQNLGIEWSLKDDGLCMGG